jgi:EmrB/QacA subfamily drug resistance transporter
LTITGDYDMPLEPQTHPSAKAAPVAWPAPPLETLDPRRWQALWIILLAAFMDILDATVVTLAIPFIQRDLGATYAEIQWVVASYQLAFATLLITGGRLGDIFGRKRLFIGGVVGFIVTSALVGVSQSPTMLIASRVLQGAVAGLMVPQVLSLMQASFPRHERGAAFGAYGAMLGLGNVGGPLIAGLLLQANLFHLTWRPIFLMNLPLGLIALVGAAVVVRESRSEYPLRLDLGGVALATTGMLLVLYPLIQGRDLGWPAWTFGAMVLAVVVFVAFARYERGREASHSALVPMSLFRQRAFVGGLLVAFTMFSGLVAFFIVYSVFVQGGLGLSPLSAGLTALAWPIGLGIGSGASIRLASSIGRPVLSSGALLMAVGMGSLIASVRAAGVDMTPWHLVPGMALGGLGMGLVAPTLTDFVLAGVPESDAGAASGVLNTIFQVGAVAGVAIIGTVFFGALPDQLGGAPTLTAYLSATESALWCEVAIFILAFALVPMLPGRPHVEGTTS